MRVVLVVLTFSILAAAVPLPPSDVAATQSGGRIEASATAEWEGEWLSVSSRVNILDKRGIFAKAAINGSSADDIRKSFLKRFGSDIERVRIERGHFTFLSADGSKIIGGAQYAYSGFVGQMSEGREIQWHKFKLTGGWGKYPALACSEPYGVLGQWILVQGDVKDSQNIFAEAQAMMLPADLATEAIAEALDTPEFISFLQSLPLRRKKEGRE